MKKTVFLDKWSFMTEVSQDRFYCIYKSQWHYMK